MVSYKELGLVNTKEMFKGAVEGGYAIPAFKELDGRAIYIVAGAPACTEELQQAGIENFIHVRVNVLDTLRELNKKLGI